MRSRALLVLLCLLAPACTDTSGVGRGRPPPTAILVDPARFLGNVACLDAPGAMRRYVATLFDISPSPRDALAVGEVTLPSSAPAPCHLGVRFTLVTPGRRYVTEIDGYDTEDITPLAPGSRVMIDSDGSVVPPRWKTQCGRKSGAPLDVDGGLDAGELDAGAPGAADELADAGDGGPERPTLDGPITVSENRTIPIRGCNPLTDLDPSRARTGILLDIRHALGGLACGDDVDAYRAVVRETGQRVDGRCDEPLALEAVTPGQGYTIDVEAEGRGLEAGPTRLVTTCFQVARQGVLVPAACDPMRRAD